MAPSDDARLLRDEVARLRLLLERSPSVAYECASGDAYRLTFVTENVATLTGYAAERFLQDASFWPTCIHSEDRARVMSRLPVASGAHVETQEYRYWHSDGQVRWVRDTRVGVAATERSDSHIAGSWLDITAEREAASDFAQLNADLEGHVSDRTAMLLSEIGEHKRTRQALTRVIASARCLLWEAG